MLVMDREAETIMAERFGKDAVIALATVADGVPPCAVRGRLLSGGGVLHRHGQPLAENGPDTGKIPGWLWRGNGSHGHGHAEDQGPFDRAENRDIANTLRQAFASWLVNGHTDPSAEETHILRVTLRDGLLLSQGTRYVLEDK